MSAATASSSAASATAPPCKQYSVPRLLWENLESVLLAQSRQFVREMAGYLRVSEKELLKQVIPSSDSIRIVMIDSEVESNQCHAYVQQDKMTVLCKKPIALHSEFCPLHQKNRLHVMEGVSPTSVQRIKAHPSLEPLWVTADDRILRSNGTFAGKRNEAQKKIWLFEVDT